MHPAARWVRVLLPAARLLAYVFLGVEVDVPDLKTVFKEYPIADATHPKPWIATTFRPPLGIITSACRLDGLTKARCMDVQWLHTDLRSPLKCDRVLPYHENTSQQFDVVVGVDKILISIKLCKAAFSKTRIPSITMSASVRLDAFQIYERILRNCTGAAR